MSAVGQRTRSATVSIPPLVAAIIAAADDVLYVTLIRSQGILPGERGRVIFVACYLAAAAALVLVAAFLPQTNLRVRLLAAGTGGLLALGLLGAFSIGLPLLAAGILTAITWGQAAASRQPAFEKAKTAALAVLASGLLLAGIALT